MAANRSAKAAVRRLWLDAIATVDTDDDHNIPLYLTLPGDQGLDIEMLVEEGIVDQTEVDGIAEASSFKIIAVERSQQAVLQLQRRFPGLKIIVQPIEDVLKATTPFEWPKGEYERFCRARVVNLDLHDPLRAHREQDRPVFPVIHMIRKLGELHASPNAINWVLCLTLHAAFNWHKVTGEAMVSFLAENFQLEPNFAADARKVLGDELYEPIEARRKRALDSLDDAKTQCVLMALIPKLVARATQGQGWSVTTAHNLRYGGNGDAPMVTWLFKFEADQRADSTPDTVYREALVKLLSAAGSIDADGEIHLDLDL